MLIRLLLSLGLVAGLLVVAARIAKKRGLGSANELIEVVARQRLGRASSVTVLRVAGHVLVVGATEAQVTLLAEVDPEDLADAIDPEPAYADADPEPVHELERPDDDAPPARPARPTRLPVQRTPSSNGALAGSVLDRGSWTTVVQELRERTVRH